MKLRKSIIVAAVGVAMSATVAKAADSVMPAPPPPPPPPAPAFDWSGPYIGAFAGVFFDPPFAFDSFEAGVQAGYNFVFNNFLVGAEIEAGAFFLGAVAPLVSGDVRAGVLVGQDSVIYGTLGLLWPGLWTAGGGVEFAVSDAVSVFGEVETYWTFAPSFAGTSLRAGVNFHPGN